MDNRKPYVIFIDEEAFDRFWIDRGKPLILGRTDINMEDEKRISRQQVEIKYNEENNLVMKQLGMNPSSITNRGSKEKTVTKRGETYPLKDGDIISLLCTKHEEKGKFRLQFPDPEDNSQPVTTDFEQTLAVSDLDILIDCIGDSQSQSRKNSSNLSSYMQRDIQNSKTNKTNNTNVIEQREVEHDNSVDKTIDHDSQKNKQSAADNTNDHAREEKEMSVHEDEKSNEQPMHENDANQGQDKKVEGNGDNNSNGVDNETELMQVEEVKLTGRKRKAPSKRQHRKKEPNDEEDANNNANISVSEDNDGEDVNEYSDGEGSPDTRHRRKRQRIDTLAENLKNLNEKTEDELEAKNKGNNNDNNSNVENNNNNEDHRENRDFSKEIASVKLLMPQSNEGDILKALMLSNGSVNVAIQRLLEDELMAKKELAKTSENIPNEEQQKDDNKVAVKKTDSDLARELQREFEAEEEESRKKIEEEDQRLAEQLWKEEQAKKQQKEEKEKEEKKQEEQKDVQDRPAVANNNEHKVENKAVQPVEDKKTITEQVKFPAYWSDQEEPLQIISLDKNSDEFQSVYDRFMSTVAVNSNVTVTKIDRIQNKRLWKWYYLKRDEIAKSNNNNAKETYLFHGTASSNMPIITKDGLDFRVANLNGSIGAGIYFAEQSSVSLGYVTASFGETPRMFLCRVALGSVTNGYSGLRVPPTIPGTDRMYDSVSSTLINGVNKIYCIFDNHQSYPEYIIYYNYTYANHFAF